jgi:transcriptional regulator with XRE-family HTH domain
MRAQPELHDYAASGNLEPWQRIRAARLAKGWSQDFLARQVGVSQPAIVNIERGWTTRSRFLPRIAKVLELDLTQLDDGLAEIVADPEGRAMRAEANFPVHASTDQGSAGLVVAANPTDYMPRPAPLTQVKGAYGVFVTGTSMEPEFRPGEIVLVNPHLPVKPGEAYIFYSEVPGASRASIKWLRRETDDRWLVTQHNPAKDFSLARSEWRWAHRLIGKYGRR